jgi:hypothetical protein
MRDQQLTTWAMVQSNKYAVGMCNRLRIPVTNNYKSLELDLYYEVHQLHLYISPTII